MIFGWRGGDFGAFLGGKFEKKDLKKFGKKIRELGEF